MIIGILALIAMIIIAIFGDNYNRRTILFFTIIISRMCLLIIAILSNINSDTSFIIVFYSIGIFFVAVEIYYLYLCTAELFSTYNRSMAFGYFSLVGRLGGFFNSNLMLLSITINLPPTAFIVIITLTSLIGLYAVRETRNSKLKDIEACCYVQEFN